MLYFYILDETNKKIVKTLEKNGKICRHIVEMRYDDTKLYRSSLNKCQNMVLNDEKK